LPVSPSRAGQRSVAARQPCASRCAPCPSPPLDQPVTSGPARHAHQRALVLFCYIRYSDTTLRSNRKCIRGRTFHGSRVAMSHPAACACHPRARRTENNAQCHSAPRSGDGRRDHPDCLAERDQHATTIAIQHASARVHALTHLLIDPPTETHAYACSRSRAGVGRGHHVGPKPKPRWNPPRLSLWPAQGQF
jgi:hypothetical protein